MIQRKGGGGYWWYWKEEEARTRRWRRKVLELYVRWLISRTLFYFSGLCEISDICQLLDLLVLVIYFPILNKSSLWYFILYSYFLLFLLKKIPQIYHLQALHSLDLSLIEFIVFQQASKPSLMCFPGPGPATTLFCYLLFKM